MKCTDPNEYVNLQARSPEGALQPGGWATTKNRMTRTTTYILGCCKATEARALQVSHGRQPPTNQACTNICGQRQKQIKVIWQLHSLSQLQNSCTWLAMEPDKQRKGARGYVQNLTGLSTSALIPLLFSILCGRGRARAGLVLLTASGTAAHGLPHTRPRNPSALGTCCRCGASRARDCRQPPCRAAWPPGAPPECEICNALHQDHSSNVLSVNESKEHQRNKSQDCMLIPRIPGASMVTV